MTYHFKFFSKNMTLKKFILRQKRVRREHGKNTNAKLPPLGMKNNNVILTIYNHHHHHLHNHYHHHHHHELAMAVFSSVLNIYEDTIEYFDQFFFPSHLNNDANITCCCSLRNIYIYFVPDWLKSPSGLKNLYVERQSN